MNAHMNPQLTFAYTARRMRLSLVLLALSACALQPPRAAIEDAMTEQALTTTHRGADDLLSAGLGLTGLRQTVPPLVSDPASAAELRRLAIWANWRGIVDLSEAGGFARLYGPAPDRSLPLVPGREYQAFAKVPGARHPHRVLAQIPDSFDRARRCLLVAPSSGSRGVYGAIGFAGAYALPRGCAVVYTDKGTGSDAFDFDSASGTALSGLRAVRGDTALSFDGGATPSTAHLIALKHAHSGDNPESAWPQHVLQAAAFGLHALSLAFPLETAFTLSNTTVVLAGLSNGGGAVLRAAELAEAQDFAAVVAIAPQLHLAGAAPLYDYGTLAALYLPCALLDPRLAHAPSPVPRAALDAIARQRCASLAAAGLLAAGEVNAQAAQAYARLQQAGFDEYALRAGAINAGFDLWRSIGATYLSAYARASAAEALCGYGFAALDANGQPRASSAQERSRWYGEHSGVAPSAGIGLIDAMATAPDPALPGLLCARAAWTEDGPLRERVRAGVAETAASGRVRAPRVLIVHGRDDGLIPAALNARPWVAAARAVEGAEIALIEIEHVQHFDAFLGLPALGAHYLPILPYAWAALDAAFAAVNGASLPPSGTLVTTPRGIDASGNIPPLQAHHLGAFAKLRE